MIWWCPTGFTLTADGTCQVCQQAPGVDVWMIQSESWCCPLLVTQLPVSSSVRFRPPLCRSTEEDWASLQFIYIQNSLWQTHDFILSVSLFLPLRASSPDSSQLTTRKLVLPGLPVWVNTDQNLVREAFCVSVSQFLSFELKVRGTRTQCGVKVHDLHSSTNESPAAVWASLSSSTSLLFSLLLLSSKHFLQVFVKFNDTDHVTG